MSNMPATISLDVRGEVCPTPLVKVVEAMNSSKRGQDIDVLTDFRPAVLAVTNAALKENWDIKIRRMSSSEWRIVLKKDDIN